MQTDRPYRVLAPPEGYVPLSGVGASLGIGHEKLLEYAKHGVITNVVKLQSGGHVRWYIDGVVAQRLIDDERAGRTMPWSDPAVVEIPRKPCPQCGRWVSWRRDLSQTSVHCCRLPEFLVAEADEYMRDRFGGPMFAVDAAGDIVKDPGKVVGTLAFQRENRKVLASTFRSADVAPDIDSRWIEQWRDVLPVYGEWFIDGNKVVPLLITALAVAAVRLPHLRAQFEATAAALIAADDEVSKAAFALIIRTAAPATDGMTRLTTFGQGRP